MAIACVDDGLLLLTPFALGTLHKSIRCPLFRLDRILMLPWWGFKASDFDLLLSALAGGLHSNGPAVYDALFPSTVKLDQAGCTYRLSEMCRHYRTFESKKSFNLYLKMCIYNWY